MRKLALPDILLVLFLSCSVIYFLVANADDPSSFFPDYRTALGMFMFTCGVMLYLRMKLGNVSLLPCFIVLIMLPYSFFYGHLYGAEAWVTLGIIGAGMFLFHRLLQRPIGDEVSYNLPLITAVIGITYAVYFSIISVLRHLNYQDASSFDTALYSQIQWNNIHGAFFHSSISGSNFVTHNSPFLILLAPFYAMAPQPATLLIIKTLSLAFSVLPFYLILKHFGHERAVLPLCVAYLFFPFIVGQNFNAPHEMCFLPPFLLYAFYFFLKDKFGPFLIFLFICLSVKEHMALIAIMFGLYGLYSGRDKRWILGPILIGIAWALFSMWIMAHFQKIYHVDPYPAWLIDNIKRRLLRPGHPLFSNAIWMLQTSNMGHSINACFIYLLLSPVGIILPFFSAIWLLGLPELIINLLATIPLTYPTWHYDIVTGIFLLVSATATIRHFGSFKTQELLSWFLCLCVCCHFFLWSDYLWIKAQPRYVQTMDAAIRTVPLNASVSMTKHLVAYVSDRKDYFLCEDKRKGDYVVLDDGETMQVCLSSDEATHYRTIFNRDGIRVLTLR